MTDFARGRPLDNDEMRALQEIERRTRTDDPDFPQRLGSRPGLWHPPARQVGVRLRPRTVACVVAVTLVYVVLLSLLPDDVVVPLAVLTLATIVPTGCLLWAARSDSEET